MADSYVSGRLGASWRIAMQRLAAQMFDAVVIPAVYLPPKSAGVLEVYNLFRLYQGSPLVDSYASERLGASWRIAMQRLALRCSML